MGCDDFVSPGTEQRLFTAVTIQSGIFANNPAASRAGVPEITVLQLRKFKAEAAELIGADGIEAVAAYLIDHPDAGDVIPGAGGARKLRWAAKDKESAVAHKSSTYTL